MEGQDHHMYACLDMSAINFLNLKGFSGIPSHYATAVPDKKYLHVHEENLSTGRGKSQST